MYDMKKWILFIILLFIILWIPEIQIPLSVYPFSYIFLSTITQIILSNYIYEIFCPMFSSIYDYISILLSLKFVSKYIFGLYLSNIFYFFARYKLTDRKNVIFEGLDFIYYFIIYYILNP